MNNFVNLPTTSIVDGRKWQLFSIEFDTADGVFSTYIYALSFEHANALTLELRQTARVVGTVEGTIPEIR